MSLGRGVTPKDLVPVARVHLDFLKSIKIAREMRQVVPSHCVDIGLCDLSRQSRMSSGDIAVQVLIPDQTLLLNDLSVDIRGP